MSLLPAEDREERVENRKRRQAAIEEFDADEKAAAEWFDGIQAAADAAMIAAGFHKHKGQWPRRRR
jgi:hypothetical protein